MGLGVRAVALPLVALAIGAVEPAGATPAENPAAQPTAERTSQPLRWRGHGARIDARGTRNGERVVHVAAARSSRRARFAAYSWPRPVRSTTAGARYRG